MLTWDFAQNMKTSDTMLNSCSASGFDSFSQLALRQDTHIKEFKTKIYAWNNKYNHQSMQYILLFSYLQKCMLCSFYYI